MTRRNFLAMATESEEVALQAEVDSDLAAPVSAEDETALVDPVEVEAEQEVLSQEVPMDVASDEIEGAIDDAEELDTLSDGIEATVEENGVGPDAFGAALAAERIASIIAKHDLPQTVKISRESLVTTSGRHALNLSLAKEADEAKTSLWEKVKKAVASFVQWIKNLWTAVSTKAGRARAKAVALGKKIAATKYKGTATVKASFDNLKAFEQKNSVAVVSLLDAYSAVNNGKNLGDKDLTDASSSVFVQISYDGDKPTVQSREQGAAEGDLSVSASDVVAGLSSLAKTLGVFNSAVSSAKSVNEKIEGGADEGAMDKAKAVIARIKARSAIMSAANKLMFRTAQQLMTVAEQVLKQFEPAGEASKAAGQAVHNASVQGPKK